MIDNESWLISIEQSAKFVAGHIGMEAVKCIFQKYNATCADDLLPCYYPEVFSELYAYEADLRD